MKLDYNKCTLNVIASIEKHYGYSGNFQDVSELTKKLEGKKHIFLILLDGLGKVIIERNLKDDSFCKQNLYDSYMTLYPPTTSAVTNAILANKLPTETGWFGWHQYFKEIDRDVILFKNKDYYTDDKLDIDIRHDRLPYTEFYKKYENDGVKVFELWPAFKENGYPNFRKQVNKMIKISKSDEETFTYCYNDYPDHDMHIYGCYSKKVKRDISSMDKQLNRLAKKMGEDSIILMIADHGLVDVELLYLKDYKEIDQLLERRPSIEARTCTFKVSDKEKFKKLFEENFSVGFELYTRDEFLKSDYCFNFNNDTSKIEEFVFDYVSVATDKYAFAYDREYDKKKRIIPPMKAHHAGNTYDELMISLIVKEK